MMRAVFFLPEARADLTELYEFIAERDGEGRADGYLNRIEVACRRLETMAELGRSREDLRPGLRVMVLERRVLIAYRVTADSVFILRILYGGRSIERLFVDLPEEF